MKILTLPPIDGPQVIARILATRWVTIAVSVAVMLVMATLGLVVYGERYTASTSVEVASVSVEPNSTSKGGSTNVDVNSELSMVRSGRTAQLTAEALGGGVTASEVLDNLAVSASQDSNIITIMWTDSDPKRARDVSAAVAEAYLQTRSELILGRLKAISDEITLEINTREESLASITAGSPAANARQESLRSSITALNSRLASLVGFTAPNGRVITPDSAVPLMKTPSKKTVFAGALGVGLFLGVIVAALRDRLDPQVRNARQLAHVVSAPVWSADEKENEQLRWFGAARMATLVGKDRGVPALLVGSSEAEAPALISALSAAQSDLRPDLHLRILDLDGPRADLLHSLSDVDQVTIAPGSTMPISDIAQLVDQIDLSGCELTGAFFIPPAPVAAVQAPAVKASAAHPAA